MRREFSIVALVALCLGSHPESLQNLPVVIITTGSSLHGQEADKDPRPKKKSALLSRAARPLQSKALNLTSLRNRLYLKHRRTDATTTSTPTTAAASDHDVEEPVDVNVYMTTPLEMLPSNRDKAWGANHFASRSPPPRSELEVRLNHASGRNWNSGTETAYDPSVAGRGKVVQDGDHRSEVFRRPFPNVKDALRRPESVMYIPEESTIEQMNDDIETLEDAGEEESNVEGTMAGQRQTRLCLRESSELFNALLNGRSSLSGMGLVATEVDVPPTLITSIEFDKMSGEDWTLFLLGRGSGGVGSESDRLEMAMQRCLSNEDLRVMMVPSHKDGVIKLKIEVPFRDASIQQTLLDIFSYA